MNQGPTNNTSSDPLPELLAFYQNANLLLRIALFTALFWPLAVIVAAILFAPHVAQTIVPIVDLIPLLAIFFLLIGAPFALAIILQKPAARRGFLWLVGAIGVELSIGVYFSTIPVSKDAGLIPLLLLTALAIFFLRVGGIARWLVRIFAFLVVVITIVFVLGGRNKALNSVEKTFKEMNEVQSASAYKSAEPSPGLTGVRNPAVPSSESTIVHKAVQPSSGSTDVTRGQQANNAPVPTRAATPAHPIVSVFGAPPPPKLFRPNWKLSMRASAGNLVFDVPPCIRRAGDAHCFFRVTNTGPAIDAQVIGVSPHELMAWEASRLVDEQGNEYMASSASLGDSIDQGNADANLPSNVPILGSVVFSGVAGSRAALLEIKIVPRFGGYIDVQYHDISIEEQ